ncbi:MAG: hypothetical protein LC796_04760 [Acidobacteria bacterium]|nr:hypothetical protein [Acidobacteriota bacterium]MCA1609629.1 hypothetical protein [Acidobacteriota bacterium]
MKSGIRVAFAAAAVAAGVAFAGASPAQAQVGFSGSFPLPHGRISIGIGVPEFPIGTCVPDDYEVYSRDDEGYGFDYESRWIPVRQDSGRWLVCEPSQAYGYSAGYGSYGWDGDYGIRGYTGGYSRYYGRNDYRYNVRAYGNRGYVGHLPRRDRDDRRGDNRWERRNGEDHDHGRGDRDRGRDRHRD